MVKDVRQSPGTRVFGLGWATILAPLGLGFLVSLALAYQAFDAGRNHRVAARAAAREHARFGAYLLANTVDRRMQEALQFGFYPIDLALSRDTLVLPEPSVLRAEPELSRCPMTSPRPGRVFFRYDPRAGSLVTDGPTSPAFERWISSSIAPSYGQRAAVADRRAVLHLVGEVDGQRRLVAYRRWKGADREVVYGFDSCWRTPDGDVFSAAIETTQAFPPTLVGATPNDSLFSLAARTGDGELVFGSEWSRPMSVRYSEPVSYYGTVAVEPAEAYAGLELRVTLLPSTAERLVQGGVPPSRLPLALGLLALTAVLMGVAIRQLRRGQELVRIRSRFVQNASHELRTPLQQILLFADLLRSGRLDGDEERRQALDIVHAETNRLIALTQNLLRFSGSPAPSVDLSRTDIACVVAETVDAFRPLAQGRGTEIRIEGEEGCVEAVTDADAFKRVLINLLDNAVKYGPDGQVVLVELATVPKWVEVSVTDRGPGIPVASRGQIWKAFSRLDREEQGPAGGSGIGLSIVRQIVDALGGEVSVRDAEPEGTCFTVRLPVAERAR